MFSNLITYSKISKNTYGKRTHVIDTIIPHVYVGHRTVKRGTDTFSGIGYKWSCNYFIADDGQIGGVLPEELASICSSNKAADERAITIEISSDVFSPYKITDAAFNSLINLCVDICKRYNIKELKWSHKKEDRVKHNNGVNIGCHRDYAAKSCPGDYLYNKEAELCTKVNQILNYPVINNDGLGIRKGVIGSIDFNKLDYSSVFDWKFYRNNYADLTANGLKTQIDFTKHFKIRGLLEARQGNSLFNPIAYRLYNKDLSDFFGDDWPWYYAHYILAGKKEGRRCL